MSEEFELWFAECIRLCACHHIGPDDYIWDLDDCAIWKEKFDNNYSSEEAVSCIFL